MAVVVDGKSANLKLALVSVLLGHELGHDTLIYTYICIGMAVYISHELSLSLSL